VSSMTKNTVNPLSGVRYNAAAPGVAAGAAGTKIGMSTAHTGTV